MSSKKTVAKVLLKAKPVSKSRAKRIEEPVATPDTNIPAAPEREDNLESPRPSLNQTVQPITTKPKLKKGRKPLSAEELARRQVIHDEYQIKYSKARAEYKSLIQSLAVEMRAKLKQASPPATDSTPATDSE